MRLKNYFLLLALIFTVCVFLTGNSYSARLSEGNEISSPAQKAKKSGQSPINERNTKVTPQANKRADKEDNTSEEKDTKLVSFNFDNVDVFQVIKWISEQTGKQFLVDPDVKGGKAIIISPEKKVTIDDAYKMFETVLEMNGLTTVPSGDSILIVPFRDAKSKNLETRFGNSPINPEDRFITQLIPLTYASPTEMSRVLKDFKSRDGLIIPYDPTGVLIVTDVKSNISSLLKIIRRIDIPGTGEQISTIQLKQADATKTASILKNVFKVVSGAAKRRSTASPEIIIEPDDRTNSLIISASEVDVIRIKQLVNTLDMDTKGEGGIQVYPLQNASAEELEKTLNNLPKNTGQPGQKGETPVLSKDVQIVAHIPTNSLVITAQKDEYETLKKVIQELDRVRPMVFIEALVMEVSMNKDYEVGVQFQAGKQDDSVTVYTASNPGVNNFPSYDSTTASVSLPTGWSSGVLGNTITIGGIQFADIGAVVRAYESDSDVQIYSNPQVMAHDNVKAVLSVNDKVPYIISKAESTGTATTGYNNYDFEKAGVSLTITPHINQKRMVRLEIDQVVSQVKSFDEAGQPTTFERILNTSVTIKDGQTVVIGGLIDNKENRTNYRVPILGRIPILGWFFRSKTKSTDKKNLYLFVTARIIEDPEEADEIYENKKGHIDTIKENAIRMHNDGKIPEDMRLVELGYEYLKLREYKNALKYYRKALKKNPENPYAIYNIGYIYQIQGQKEKAIEMYERLIAMDPPERAVESSDHLQTGRKLTDMAKDNLKSLKADE